MEIISRSTVTFLAVTMVTIIQSVFMQGSCGNRLCLEYTSATIQHGSTNDGKTSSHTSREENPNEYVFQQSRGRDFVIEWGFTEYKRESLVEVTVKHNGETIAYGDRDRFQPLVTNRRSLTGRYEAYLAPLSQSLEMITNFVLVLRSVRDEYAQGVYTITVHYRTGTTPANRGDERFERIKFTFGIKVNGGYSTWKQFGQCAVVSDSNSNDEKCSGSDNSVRAGYMLRKRTCTEPVPRFGGTQCKPQLGPDSDQFPCLVFASDGSDVEKSGGVCESGNKEKITNDTALDNFQLQSFFKREGIALLDMLEFGFHCFLTPTTNINYRVRYPVNAAARASRIPVGNARALLGFLYSVTLRTVNAYLHCSLVPCQNKRCHNVKFLSKRIEKEDSHLVDLRLSVGVAL